MQLLDLTLDSPAANLALDEALLEAAEAGEADHTCENGEVLRLWEAPAPTVVIGRSSKIADEVDLAACERRGVPVLRRSSGGAAIVAGPGCLMYAVILSHALHPEVARIDEAHRTVLTPLAEALGDVLPGVTWAGTSDLALDGRKFSGNSLRCKRTHLVYHGTLLYDFDLTLVEELLKTPPRQPEYRAARPHGDFVRNLPIAREQLCAAVLQAFPTSGELTAWPAARTAQLVAEKYSLASWNARL